MSTEPTSKTFQSFQLSLFERALAGLLVAGIAGVAVSNFRDQPVANAVTSADIKALQTSSTRIEASISDLKSEFSASIRDLQSRVRELELSDARRSRP